MCKNVKLCVAVHVDLGGEGGHTQFLERKVFLYGDICVTLYELKCKFLCSETVFCIVIGRQGFHGWEDSTGRQNFAGGQDLSGVLGELYIL